MSNEAEKPKAEDEDPKKAKLRSEFDALSAEMEVANYAVNHYAPVQHQSWVVIPRSVVQVPSLMPCLLPWAVRMPGCLRSTVVAVW